MSEAMKPPVSVKRKPGLTIIDEPAPDAVVDLFDALKRVLAQPKKRKAKRGRKS